MINDVSGPSSGGSLQRATFGGGCFRCTEAVFLRIKGVCSVMPGYMGGHDNPTYEEVRSGTTDHVEVIQIEYDPELISYEMLLNIFFSSHDPTTPDRQGIDEGPQYASRIFTHTPEQKEIVDAMMKSLEEESVFDDSVVTKVGDAVTFRPAEDYHQDYYKNNPKDYDCVHIITPKLQKLRKSRENYLNDEAWFREDTTQDSQQEEEEE